MSSRPVRAVLFDAGGTLFGEDALRLPEVHGLARLAGTLGQPAPNEEQLSTYLGLFFGTLRDEMTAISGQDFYLHGPLFTAARAAACRGLGWGWSPAWEVELVTDVEHVLRSQCCLLPGVKEALTRLRMRAVVIGVVSNGDEEVLATYARGLQFDELVNFSLSSESAASCKPHSAIFRGGLERAGTAPDETIYVGDIVPFDVVGANRAGMRSVLTVQKSIGITIDAAECDEARPDYVLRELGELLDILE